VKPKVDPDLCTGCEVCVELVPEVFEMGDDELAHVINASPPEDLNDKIQEAVDSCPSGAISAD
jgi:ferredoxin